MKPAAGILATMTTALWFAACSSSPASSTGTPPQTQPPPASTASLVATFTDNPVPFRSTGCNASVPQGWYTTARVEERSGVAFKPSTLTQKLDGNAATFLAESFDSRFGACPGGAFDPGTIRANGAACAVIGVCTVSSFNTYQFEITGTDANGHALTFVSPLLQLGTRAAGQSILGLIRFGGLFDDAG